MDFGAMAPGTVSRGILQPDLGHPVELPFIVVRGARPGPTLLVTAGVHGAEYASVEAAYRLARLDPAALSGTLLVLPVVNPPSFFTRSIYVNPIDGKNLNRCFPGDASGSFAERLAHYLTGHINGADAYIDLHGGDLVEALTPFTIFKQGDAASLELAQAFGIELLVPSESRVMSLAAAQNIPAILAEAGGQGQWPESEVERLRGGVERAMQHLGLLPGTSEARTTRQLSDFAWFSSAHSGLWYPAVIAGDTVQVGQSLGQVRSLLGDPLQKVVSTVAGVVLFAVSSLAMNAGDPLLGIGA